jgi:cell shape-determining protein MreC
MSPCFPIYTDDTNKVEERIMKRLHSTIADFDKFKKERLTLAKENEQLRLQLLILTERQKSVQHCLWGVLM